MLIALAVDAGDRAGLISWLQENGIGTSDPVVWAFSSGG